MLRAKSLSAISQACQITAMSQRLTGHRLSQLTSSRVVSPAKTSVLRGSVPD
nr:MAG TPA: hypothetical protein [Caudoviricetes sp.]